MPFHKHLGSAIKKNTNGAPVFRQPNSCVYRVLRPVFLGTAHAQIVALGASTTEGYGVGWRPGAFPARLEALLEAKGYNVSVTNAGISGDTTWGMLNRLESAVPLGTKIVILEVWGGYFNDLRNGISLQQGRANVAEIMRRLEVRNIRVIPFRSLHGLPRGADGLHLSSELDFGQNLNGLAIDQGTKHGVHQFLYGHGQAETARKIAVVSTYPANALSPALSKLAKVELRVRQCWPECCFHRSSAPLMKTRTPINASGSARPQSRASRAPGYEIVVWEGGVASLPF